MLIEDLEMRIPVLALLLAVVDVDERHAGLHEPAGQQQVLSAHVPGVAKFRAVRAAAPFSDTIRARTETVAFTSLGVFLRDVERLTERIGI